MDVDSGHDFGGWLTPLGRNLLAILLAYPLVIGFVYVSRNLDGRYWREAMAIAFVVGSIPAIALGARPVAYGLLGQGVFGLVEFAFHLVAGIDKVQGGQAHWTVMIAGTLAVVCGATIERGRRTAVIGVIWNPKDLVGSAVRVGTLLRRRTGLLAHGAAALFSFGLSEAAVHLVFGLHPFRDNVTHAAILAAAILGAAMGGLSESFGMRPSVPRRTAAGA